jgi:Uncharacterised protein family (UPF0236)
MDGTTQSEAFASFVQSMTERMTSLACTLGTWVQAEPRTLHAQEEQVVRQLHELGSALLAGLLTLTPHPTARTVRCPCGAQASYRRRRAATVTTLLGPITYTRATYRCASCHQGHAPLDRQLQVAAGSLSMGLQELLALLGATQNSFPDAAAVLQRLCLVQVCPNTVRSASEDLGAVLAQHMQEAATAAQEPGGLDVPQPCVPARLYVSMDGVVVHCRSTGWREIKTGCVYTTRACRSRRAPYQHTLRMEQPSYGAALAEADAFGWQLYVEASRRGVAQAHEVIVIGDGAHWIWNLADQLFPGATQIVDWYHASQYVWNAATAIHGDGTAARAEWAQQQLDALWEGRLADVLLALELHAEMGGAVEEAVSYYTTHRTRMDYPAYRARELQIGSGTIESTCKHLVSARLKQAGMIWSEAGANALVGVRAWLKSGRWQEAMALRPIPQRSYQRQRQTGVEAQAERQVVVEVATVVETPSQPQRQVAGLPSEVLARVRAELAQEQATHPWRKAWSRRQQRAQHAERLARQ